MAQTLTPQQIFRRRTAGEPVAPGDAPQDNRHVISVLLENSVGALNRVANLFSARGFNLESVSVGETDDPAISRLTIVTTGNDRIIGQVIQQLGNLVDSLGVDDLTGSEHVERELCLLKVACDASTRGELMDVAKIFRANIINVAPDSMMFEVTGPTTKVNAFIGMMRPMGIREVARSGRVAMRRQLIFGD